MKRGKKCHGEDIYTLSNPRESFKKLDLDFKSQRKHSGGMLSKERVSLAL